MLTDRWGKREKGRQAAGDTQPERESVREHEQEKLRLRKR